MIQLVGLKCVRCQGTIGDIIEGRFCPCCGNPVHVRCLDTNAVPAADNASCQACGGDVGAAIAQQIRWAREEPERRRQEAELKSQQAEEDSRELGSYFLWQLRGVDLLILGLGLLWTFPKLRSHGSFAIGPDGIAPWLAMMVAGAALIVLSFVFGKKRK